MCLYTIQTKIRIAKKDIPVYKVLETEPDTEGLLSLYRYEEYKLGELKLASIGVMGRPYPDVRILPNFSTACKVYIINQGLHSFTSLRKAEMAKRPWNNATVFKAIIPKGSEYICGIHGDIVSNQLVVLKEL